MKFWVESRMRYEQRRKIPFRKEWATMTSTRWLHGLLVFGSLTALAFGQKPVTRLELVPPSPVTDKIVLDIRGAVENTSSRNLQYRVSLYLDRETPATRVYFDKLLIPAHGNAGIYYRRSTANWAGRHRVILVAASIGGQIRTERKLRVLPYDIRSTRTIGGAWVGILHWSNDEARDWNPTIRKLTENDWRQQIRGMHDLGMDIVVVQQVFQNQEYYGRNTIATTGYQGTAFYPSALFPGRVQISSHDPLEAILSEADRLHMHVFLGVGMYAWFDYSAASLEWHKKVAAELWHRYGHHPSFYGWYVSEEGNGSLVPEQGELAKDRYRHEIVTFFSEFQAFCRKLAPEKPVMLAPNTFGLLQSQDVWPILLKHIDIVCPFAFDRMPSGDITGEQAAKLWQKMSDQAGSHLWMDMEAFVFNGKALVPRPIGGLIQDIQRFPNFEKILCYQYSGMFNSPRSRIKPGGPATIVLYRDYQQYLQGINRDTGRTSYWPAKSAMPPSQ
ncbi:MAG: DUF4434 domain-containing protein [Acidobacteriaceae bacterium]